LPRSSVATRKGRESPALAGTCNPSSCDKTVAGLGFDGAPRYCYY
jgi:hypothetical protein